MRLLGITAALLGATLLAGCNSIAPMGQNLELTTGPAPRVTSTRLDTALSCVAGRLKPSDRQTSMGIITFPDRTGKANFNSENGTGAFNTQGAADMLAGSFVRGRVRLVEMGPEYRSVLDWQLAKAKDNLIGNGGINILNVGGKTVRMPNVPLIQGTVRPVVIGIIGAITATDIIPGGGASVGVGGVSASYSQNRAVIRIDMRAIKMPIGSDVGGEVIATTTVEKQIVQDDTELSKTRFFGSATSAQLD
ncbi:MAG: hypothetical protein JWO43_547, partial [Candidatus Adlerbacteria bacterium]|nr:hypothetical protein [Candidatus Adlerbacteria bacterium]